MNARMFEGCLVNDGYTQLESRWNGIRLYGKNIRGNLYIVGILNCMADCQFTGTQLGWIKNELFYQYNSSDILYVAFSYDPYNTQQALNGDFSHWIYDENGQRLMIYDNQPQSFLNIDELLQREVRTPNKVQYRQTYTLRDRIFMVNNLFVLINIVIFIIQEVMGDTQNTYFLMEHGALHAGTIINGGEYYRIFTSMFMHSGIGHLVNNMIVLFFIGDNLERAVGRIKFTIIYLGSGIIGNLTAMWYYYNYDPYVCCVGASGAIFGVVGALIYVLIVNKGRLEDLSLTRMLIYVALSIYLGISNGGVSNSAHIGGLIGGFILAAVLYRKRGSGI